MDNEILIPKLGWSIDEATFVEWLKSNGEYINTGDEIFSVESEKFTIQSWNLLFDNIHLKTFSSKHI